MNATTSPVTPVSKLRWLLKREYWENRGGFLYAPVIAGIASLLMSSVGIVLGLLALRRAAAQGELSVGDHSVQVNGLDLALLTQNLSGTDLEKLGRGLDVALAMSSTWPFVVLAFVVFFYCLGALYDDRRDRSILFWKSLPISDAQTVLSKVLSALVVAPAIATAAAIVTMLLFMVVLAIVVAAHGGDAGTLVLGPTSPMVIALGHIIALPVYALWALPTVGWLLLCSSWARSKPFLWAVMLPLFAGIVVSTTRIMQLFDSTSGWFWQHIVGRLLLGTFPGVELVYRGRLALKMESITDLLSPSAQWAALARPELWIGAAIGTAMIVLAVRLRRRAGEI